MKTAVKKESKCQVKLTVTLEAEETKAIVKDVEKIFMREAQIPGFRKGKVPLDIIRKEFGNGLKQEVEQSMFRKYYAKAVEAEKLDEVACVGLDGMKYDDNGGEFVAVVDVRPVFKLPTYKGLKVSEKSTAVKDEEVTAQIDRLRAGYARYEDAKEGEAAADTDYVQIDYSGTVGGKSILEINPEAKFVAEGKGFWTVIEEGRFLPEILDALKGMKAGETKEGIKAKFDKNSAPEGLKGEKAVYTVTLVKIRHVVPANDEELVAKTQSESMEKLVGGIRERMEKAAVEQEEQRRISEAVELLMKKVDFDVPGCQVSQATEGYLKEFAARAQYSGLDVGYFEKNQDKIMAEAQAAAERQVRLSYVIEAIAREEKIEASDEERGKKVVEFILANAKK